MSGILEGGFPIKSDKKKILIIGAGLAGIAACNRLNDYGFDVTILEARSRCGGRIWTDDTLGIPFGKGAGWIHGNKNNPIASLADQYHAQYAAFDQSKSVIYDQGGHIILRDIVLSFEEKFSSLLSKAKEFALQNKEDISLADALAVVAKHENFSITEWDLYRKKLTSLEAYLGASGESLSARYWDSEESLPGDHCYLISSYRPILDGLLKGCRVKLNTTVVKIIIQSNEVEVVTENEIFRANAVIITVPLGVLKKNAITFDPPLPTDKKNSIQKLGMGLFNITAIKFPVVFWPNQLHAMYFTQFNIPSISTFYNLHHFINQAILVGYRGGESARQLEELSDDQLINEVMLNFKKILENKFLNLKPI